ELAKALCGPFFPQFCNGTRHPLIVPIVVTRRIYIGQPSSLQPGNGPFNGRLGGETEDIAPQDDEVYLLLAAIGQARLERFLRSGTRVGYHVLRLVIRASHPITILAVSIFPFIRPPEVGVRDEEHVARTGKSRYGIAK